MSQGDCPKHGRWYGICHSCNKEEKENDRRETLQRLYAERDEARANIVTLEGCLREFCESIEEDCDATERQRVARSFARALLKGKA